LRGRRKNLPAFPGKLTKKKKTKQQPAFLGQGKVGVKRHYYSAAPPETEGGKKPPDGNRENLGKEGHRRKKGRHFRESKKRK